VTAERNQAEPEPLTQAALARAALARAAPGRLPLALAVRAFPARVAPRVNSVEARVAEAARARAALGRVVRVGPRREVATTRVRQARQTTAAQPVRRPATVSFTRGASPHRRISIA
jgi:hypothetical protein